MRSNEMINGNLPGGTEAIPLPGTIEDAQGRQDHSRAGTALASLGVIVKALG